MLPAFLYSASLFSLFASPAAAGNIDYSFYPPEPTKRSAPVFVFVHGGAWISGDKAQHESLARAFAGRGFCAITLNYPLAPQAPHPAPVRALDRALREVPALLPTPTCDRARIFLAGHSAGAHLIAQWNSSYRNEAVKGFVGLEGIYDLPKLAERWPAYPDWFLKKAFGGAENWAKASPARLSPLGKAPWLVIHSEQDELVDLQQSKLFANWLEEKGVPAELLVIKTGAHDEVIRRFGQAGDAATERAVKFLKP